MYEAELAQSIWAGIAKQSTVDLYGQDKGPACSIWVIWGSGMLPGYHTQEADDLHSHPVSSSLNKAEVSVLQA